MAVSEGTRRECLPLSRPLGPPKQLRIRYLAANRASTIVVHPEAVPTSVELRWRPDG